jgi:hypothetical protein
VLDLEGASWQAFHQKRQDVIDLIKPDAVRGAQPFVLKYTGGNTAKPLYGYFRYESGLNFSNARVFSENPIVRLLAVDPFWYEDNQETASLTLQSTVSNANGIIKRKNGAWVALGTGTAASGLVKAIVADKQTGRVYIGGSFATFNSVTVNSICYWNGTTAVAMGGATKGVAGGEVRAIAIAPNGDVWVGGSFTSAGGTATDGIARWNKSADTWTVFALGAGAIYNALVIDSQGNLYGGGAFANWNGDANQDRVNKYDGTTWSALSTGFIITTPCEAIEYGDDNHIYFAGGITGFAGVLYWDASANSFAQLGATSVSAVATIYGLAVAPNKNIIAVGDFTTMDGVTTTRIAEWTGTGWRAVGGGLQDDGNAAVYASDGMLYIGGIFTTAGGLSLLDRLVAYDGLSYLPMDVDLPGTPTVHAIATVEDDIYVGYDAGASNSATASAQTTVTTTGTVVQYPRISIVGPSSAFCNLLWIENQTTDERLYFTQRVNSGETMTLDLTTIDKLLVSDFQGRINNQPLGISDAAAFHLQAGANVISAFVNGTVTAAVLLINWTPTHWSLDGTA